MKKKWLFLLSALFIFGLSQIVNAKDLTLALSRNTITPAEETFTFAVPKQLGYFAMEGISPKILSTDGSTAAIQAVASGSADIAYASSLNIAAAIDKGVPIKAFAGITVQWPYFIGVPKGSEIKSIADLKGKRIGVISFASASYADLRANLKLFNLTENDVTIVPIGAGARAAAAISNNQVDAIDSYSDSFTIIEQNGVELELLERPAEMEKLFSVTMVTSEKALQENPEQLAKFARAAYKGIIYTQLYPKSALKLSFAEFPMLSGASDPTSKEAENTMAAMKVALGDSTPANIKDPTKWQQWLNITPDRWEALLNFAYETGSTEKLLTVNQIWNGALIPQIFDFDISAIKEKK